MPFKIDNAQERYDKVGSVEKCIVAVYQIEPLSRCENPI
jgi:hypothetical protein